MKTDISEIKGIRLKKIEFGKKSARTGNRTLVARVTGGYTYTMQEWLKGVTRLSYT